MGFRCGIVGLPNVGKSTIFNALTANEIAAENYPFCTIDPNVGVVPMPDARLDRVAEIARPEKVVPTTMEFVDIAGLVAGASKGEGLGNKFLGNIRETQAIAHVVRCFDDPDVVHVSTKIEPLSDMEIINTELLLADMESVDKALQKAIKASRGGDKDALAQQALLERLLAHLDSGESARTMELGKEELEVIGNLFLLTMKPTLYIANVAEDGFEDNAYLDAVREHAAGEGAEVVPICARIEAELAVLEPEEQQEFLTDLGLEEPGLNRVIRAGYRLLKLETFFTAGPKEAHAWTIAVGATAPQAAGKIHTDFERGFIRAEVIAYDDYIACNGEQGAREAGKLRLEGKDYGVRDGDVIYFRFNI